jgi:hypothetical protein
LANAPLPPIPQRSWLWGFGFHLELIGYKFNSIYESIQGVWLLGPYLGIPFYIIRNYFFTLRDLSWQGDTLWVNLQGWIEGIVNGPTFSQLLDNLSYHYNRLRYDPIGWVREHIGLVSNEFNLIRTDPYGWVRNKLFSSLPIMQSIIYSTATWLRTVILTNWPEFGGLLDNTLIKIRDSIFATIPTVRNLHYSPIDTIVNFLATRYPFLRSFLSNPAQSILDFIAQLNYTLSRIIRDPIDWLRDMMVSILNISVTYKYNITLGLIHKVLSLLVSNESGILNSIETSICDIICWFM